MIGDASEALEVPTQSSGETPSAFSDLSPAAGIGCQERRRYSMNFPLMGESRFRVNPLSCRAVTSLIT